MTTELQTTEQTAQALIQILTLNKNTGAALEKLLKLPLLDADNKIPAGVLRIVGALSAGHIIESGDNANGNYVRFADGTQICWHCWTKLYNCVNAAPGGLYYSSGSTGEILTYPATFALPPSVTFTVADATLMTAENYAQTITYITGAASLGTTTETPYLTVLAFGSAPNHNVACYYIAIGKWK